MCGISGIVHPLTSGREVKLDQIKRLRNTLTHRGPDDTGIYFNKRVGLGHNRLSIVDVTGGHQPMLSDDGSLCIVYNGEVYNHEELRAELCRRGHRYRTKSDTETVLRCFQEYREGAVGMLRGMFAFAVWDERRQELFLARDRLGIKPLYYATDSDGSISFASEIKALVEGGTIRPAINLSVLPDYLANHSPSGAETLFQGVRRLPPGHTLTWREGQVEVRSYWDLPDGRREPNGARDERLIAEFMERLRESVRLRLMSDVPLGAFLSGGIDSAVITALMSRLVPEPIKTFSVGFGEREANELAYARIVARAFRTDHHEVVITPDDFFHAVPKLVWHEDEPLAHPSSVALYFVARLASKHVKVVLTGEGSDELLAGYGRYARTLFNLQWGHLYRRATPRVLRSTIRRGVEQLPPGLTIGQKLKRTFLFLPLDLESIYFDNFAVFSRRQQQTLLSRSTLESIGDVDPYAVARRHLCNLETSSVLNRLLYVDAKTYLHELLMKQDQMSMAASVESRVPFLDHELAEFTARLPQRLKLRGLTTKVVLRRAMAQLLPQEILERPKMGFPVPLGVWLQGEFSWVLDDYVTGPRAAERGLLNMEAVRGLVHEHRSGRVDHSERLWALINLEIWQRRFLDGERVTMAQERFAEYAAP